MPKASVPKTIQANSPCTTPHYWEQACAELIKGDRVMRRLIPKYPGLCLVSRGDPFMTLARSIVGQQISVKAADTVWARLQQVCPRFSAKAILKLETEQLAACGLSKRKTEYISDLAGHFEAGTLHVARWTAMEDEEIIAELTAIRGIGRWTAEMFLMFNLLRPNVLPLDDLGLLKAISVHYFSGDPVSRSDAREVAANWTPWRTVATWYLWRSLDPVPVEY